MLRHYFARRSCGGDSPLRVGTIAVGSIYYLQDEGWWRDRFRGKPQCCHPWIVESFLTGIQGAAHRDPVTGHWRSLHVAHFSDTALVRSLRDGRRSRIQIHTLQNHDDEALWHEPTLYPELPPPRSVEHYLQARGHTR
jgi:hypothetical protein